MGIREFFSDFFGGPTKELKAKKKSDKPIVVRSAVIGTANLTNRAKHYAKIGLRNGYVVEQEQPANKLLILTKNHGALGPVQINVYYTTHTIGTSFKHPTKGRTQLFRRNVSDKMFEAILVNPRAHTEKGHY